MTKKYLPFFSNGITIGLVIAICIAGFFSCKKRVASTGDKTRNFFPITYGKYIAYDVDSIYYGVEYDTSALGIIDTLSVQYEVKSQMKYAITDTTRGNDDSLLYIADIFYRHYDGDFWEKQGAVIYLRVNADSIIVTQDGSRYTKMKFPVVNGYSWKGNALVDIHNPVNAYLNNWTYTYQNMGLQYCNNLHTFDNTVTVLEDDESVNYPLVDSAVQGYRTYAKEVYACDIGMVYKEWTHWVYLPNRFHSVSGYTVVMRAVDFN